MIDENEVARVGFVSLVRTYSGGNLDGYSVLSDGNFVKRLAAFTDDYRFDEEATINLFLEQIDNDTIFDAEEY